jgi:hypothetical protein
VSRSTGILLLGAMLIMTPGTATSEKHAAPLQPAEPDRPREPTARYASLEAARDSIGALVRRCIGPLSATVHVSRDTVTFEYIYTKASARGWVFRVVLDAATECPDVAVEEALRQAGWVEHLGYMADGQDGSSMGFLCRNYFCLVEGRWDGGDPTDSTYVPSPGCQVIVTCVPRRKDDFPPP